MMQNLNKNITQIFFRFLKENNAFSNFTYAIQHNKNGKPLYETFYALKFDPKGKYEYFHDDPLRWIMNRKDINAVDFLKNIINTHIIWDKSKEGAQYWHKLHNKWIFILMKNDYHPNMDFLLQELESEKKNKKSYQKRKIKLFGLIAMNIIIWVFVCYMHFFR